LPVTYIDYRPAGAAKALLDCDAPEVLIEGPAGTGKTRAVLEKLCEQCESSPGLRVLLCRATRTSLTESVLVTLETKVLGPMNHPALTSSSASRAMRHSYDWPNGSTIVCGGLDNPERLYSTEWDIVYVAECTEITEDSWERFARAMRNGRGPYHQRIACCNPGPPSHWLNQRCNRGAMVRLKSRHRDNPSCTPQYLGELARLTGHRRARLYEGRWVAAEGIVFPEFSEDQIVSDFDVPDDWPVFVGIDPGFDHPCAILWIALAPNRELYVIDELYRGGLSIAQHAADIKARNPGRNVQKYFADPQHAWSRTAQSPKPIAQQFRDCGIAVQPWPRSTDKQAMVEAVRERMRAGKLFVLARCANMIAELQSWSYKRRHNDPDNPPPGDDAYEDCNNHAIDALCGMVAAGIDRPSTQIRLVGGM
jgi:PBSX family phage terminase large subunit